MLLNSLFLRNFRNYKKTHIFFCPSINYITGENAQGKTNLLEAISLLITGRSFRTSKISDCVSFGENFFFLELSFFKNGIEQVLSLYFDGKGKKIILNSNPVSSLASLVGLIPGIIFSTEDINLIKGNPSKRRQFINTQIAQTDKNYIHHLIRYNKSLKNRNFLLKNRKTQFLDVWEEQLAVSGAFIIKKRQEFIYKLNHFSDLFQIDKTILSYKTFFKEELTEEKVVLLLKDKFFGLRDKEIGLGLTLIGPHRDDLTISIVGQSAMFFSSEGQKRSCIGALKFASWQLLKSNLKEDILPLMCIDDLETSLDSFRKEQFFDYLPNFKQVFLTSSSLLPGLSFQGKIFTIHKGEVEEEKVHIS